MFINYIGSKRLIIPYILDLIPTGTKTVLDGFSGSGRVSYALAKNYHVISNDIAAYSHVLNQAYLMPRGDYDLAPLNSLKGIEGWFTKTYGTLHKQPLQHHNLMRLDAIRSQIDDPVLIAALLLGIEKVSNTVGHWVSYLREYSKRSYRDLTLVLPPHVGTTGHQVYCQDIFDVLDLNYDLAYFDIPYGSNNDKMPSSRVRYQQYYHFLDTVALNDEPAVRGVVGRRATAKASEWEAYQRTGDKFVVEDLISKLIAKTKSSIIFSYNNNGRVPIPRLLDILGQCEIVKINHRQNVMSSMTWTNDWSRELKNQEYLFLVP